MKTSLENVSRRFYAVMDTRDLRVQREYPGPTPGTTIIDATLPEFRIRFIKHSRGIDILVGPHASSEMQPLHQAFQQALGTTVDNDPEILTDHLLNNYDQLTRHLSAHPR
jgi:hypothetical protein